MKVILTIGVSGSGKSFWANEQKDYIAIERDDVRRELLLTKTHFKYSPQYSNMWAFYDFAWEGDINEMHNKQIDIAIKNKSNIIIGDTNLDPVRRNALISKFEEHGYEVELKYFPIDYSTAITRDKYRQHSVGETIINKQWYQWLQLPREHTQVPQYIKDRSKPMAIISDIDGTIARRVDRHPYDWEKVIEDEPIHEVIRLVNFYGSIGHKIIFMSGRDEICRDDTVKWINRYIDYPYELYMRSHKSNDKDEDVKAELFWALAPNYNFEVVIDDRHAVCRLWENLGLKLINVGSMYNIF